MKHLIAICLLASLLTGCMTVAERQYSAGEVAFKQQDYHQAYQYLQKAAQYGNVKGQYALGYLYYYGLGTPQNDVLARHWLYRSASFGNPSAMAALEAMDQNTPPLVTTPKTWQLPAPRQTIPTLPPPKQTAKG